MLAITRMKSLQKSYCGRMVSPGFGYIDEDNFVYYRAKKECYSHENDKNIYPEEIETLLNRSPFITGCVIYGKEGEGEGDVEVAAEICGYGKVGKIKNENPAKEQVYKLIEEGFIK